MNSQLLQLSSRTQYHFALWIFVSWSESFTFENMRTSANLSILDYVLLPFVLALVYSIAFKIRNSRYSYRHPWRKYFIPALTVKIFGAIFIGLIYSYYYKGGDTFNYFNQAGVINSSFDESFLKWINLIFHIPTKYDNNYYAYISQMSWYSDVASYTVCSITAVLGIITYNTYLPTAVIFAFISFTGIWALFRTFASLYPQFTKPIAIAVLFIPSVFVWGSGIFKDTICIFGLGWLTYGTFRFLVHKDFSFSNILLSVLSFILIAKVKIYILLGFIPALLIWLLFRYTHKIRSSASRLFVKIVFLSILAGGFLFFMRSFGNQLGKYSLENVVATSSVTRGWIYYASSRDEEASAYSLGDFSPTVGGMLSKFPMAVNVTLFRPYVWEAKKIIVALSALEALLFLLLTLKILFTIGPARIWKTVSNDATIQFCLIFAIIFAFAVGISSYNFGALSRYKIPCLPFYALALVLIHYKNAPGKKLFKLIGI